MSFESIKILLMDEAGPIINRINKPPAKLLVAKLDGLEDPDPTYFEIFCYRPDNMLTSTLKGSVSLFLGLQKIFTLPIEKQVGIWKIVITISKDNKVEVLNFEINLLS
jgi:hypothetical protein